MTIAISGYSVEIDDEDYSWISLFDWKKKPGNKGPYFCLSNDITVSLHRLIMRCYHGDGKIVDHKNLNTLDNRRENLRLVTIQQSNDNRRRSSKNRSGFKGIWREKGRNKWRACIKVNKRKIYLGNYLTPELAYAAYCEASKKYHGEYGRC